MHREIRNRYNDDPPLSSLVKIAKALCVPATEFFTADDIFEDVNSVDKTLMEKISLIDGLDKKEKAACLRMLSWIRKN